MRLRSLIRRLTPAASLAVVVALAGCSAQPAPGPTATVPEGANLSRVDVGESGQNGLWYLPSDEAVTQIIDAASAARWVKAEGTVVEQIPVADTGDTKTGRTLSLSFAGSADSYTASVTAGAVHIDIVAADRRAYVTGNTEYAAHVGIPELADGYVCVPATDGILDEWRSLLDPVELLTMLLTGPAAELAVMEPESAEADTLDVVIGDGSAPLGVLNVSAVGPPLPLAYTAGDASGDGTFSFTEWGEQRVPPVPQNVVVACG